MSARWVQMREMRRRSNAAQIRCNVAPAVPDSVFEGSLAIPATQRVSLGTAMARARRYLSFAATSALLSTRKRVTSRCPSIEDTMSAVEPLITEIRKIELNCSGARDLKNHVVEGVVLFVLRLKVCAALHEKTSDIKFSIERGQHERSLTPDNRN